MNSGLHRAVTLAAILWLTACASTPQSTELLRHDADSAFDKPVALNDVSFFPQEAFQCGPASLATVLQSSNVQVTPEQLVSHVYLPDRKGSLQVEMLAASRAFGRISYLLQPSLQDIFKEISQQRPVLVLQNLGLGWYPRWHYAVVVGYDLAANRLLLRSGIIRDYSMPLRLFERTWQRAGHWAMVVLAPGELPAEPRELPYFESIAALEHANPDVDIEPAYLAGLGRWPHSEGLMMGLGNLWYRQGRKREAATQYALVIKQHPSYAPAENNLAQVLFDLGDREAALDHARAAVRLGGTHSHVFQATLEAIEKP